MSGAEQSEIIRQILEQDRLWTAYALADLDPIYAQGARWLVGGQSVILQYWALDPPVLFLHGQRKSLAELMADVPAGPAQFMVREPHRQLLMKRLRPDTEVKMWRMALEVDGFDHKGRSQCQRLGPADLPAIADLIAGHPDQPDAFSQFQLTHGIFYGSWIGGQLVALAGTHVLSIAMDVAAVGNVFTHPNHRGQGHGQAVSAAVVTDLIERDIGTIVLNVAQDNTVAINLYRNLGFWPVYGYYEGVGSVGPAR